MSLSNKKLIILLSITVVALAGITTALILITPKPIDQTDQANIPVDIAASRSLISQPTSPVPDESSLAIKSLHETYLIPDGDTYSTTIDSVYKELEVIKNQDIKAKINQEFQSACDKTQSKSKNYEDSYQSCYLYITPGDTASFSTYVMADYEGKVIIPDEYIDKGYEVAPHYAAYHVATKNYRLDTGEEIKLGDLFVAGTDLTPIIAGAAHEAINCLINSCGMEYQGAADIPDIDAEVLRILQVLRDAKDDILFSFDNRIIKIFVENYTLSIRMSDWYDKIAIYKRFKSSKNLYTVEFLPPQFVFGYIIWANYKNDFISENIFARVYTGQQRVPSCPADEFCPYTNIEPDDVPNQIVAQRNKIIETVLKQATAHVQNETDIYLLGFDVYLNLQEKGGYNIQIFTQALFGDDNWNCFTVLCKLPLSQPTKNSTLDLITAAVRRIAVGTALYFDEASIGAPFNSASGDTEFWPTINVPQKISDDTGVITFSFDASGTPITPAE